MNWTHVATNLAIEVHFENPVNPSAGLMFFRRLALYQKMRILALDLSIQENCLGEEKLDKKSFSARAEICPLQLKFTQSSHHFGNSEGFYLDEEPSSNGQVSFSSLSFGSCYCCNSFSAYGSHMFCRNNCVVCNRIYRNDDDLSTYILLGSKLWKKHADLVKY